MNKSVTAVILGSTLLAFSGFAVAADQDQQRDQTRDQVRDQSREQVIYGYQLMTQQEREQYQQQMRNAKTAEERERLRNEHHEKMQARAQERGVMLPDMPPKRGGGMNQGNGMGPGSGMGDGRGR
jgi:hypothetical protein